MQNLAYLIPIWCFLQFNALEIRADAEKTSAAVAKSASQWVEFEVRETAGIRRRSDVVHAELQLSQPPPANTTFRILEGSRAVPAQVFPHQNAAGKLSQVTFDFIANFAPRESRRYRLEYGPQVVPAEVPPTQFQLSQNDNAFQISNRNIIEWTLRKDLSGLFGFLLKPDVDYVRETSAGLVFRPHEGELTRLTSRRPTTVNIVNQGPIACALEYQYADWPTGCQSTVTLDFVRTKSWAHVVWQVKGESHVQEMGAELSLALDTKETLLDFAGADFVYATVKSGQLAVLEQQPLRGAKQRWQWQVLHGTSKELTPLVVSAPEGEASLHGGWIHVMDRSRCSALAFGDFGKSTADRFEIDGDGRVLILRKFDSQSVQSPNQRLEFWIHFVGMPVHIGARTSPQSMRSPLQVKWLTNHNQ